MYEIRHASATHATLNCELGGRVISSLLTWAEVEAEFDVLADLFRSAGFECLRIKKTLHVLIGTAQQIDELFKHCCSTETIQAGRIKGVQTLVGKRWTYLGGCFAGEKGRKYADIYELLPEGTKLRPVRYSYQGRMVSYRKQNYVLGQKVVACAKWWFRELERDHITSRVPAPNNPTSDRLQKIAQLEAECDRIQAEGEIAPANCWLERPPCHSNKDNRQVFYRSKQAIFKAVRPKPGSPKMVKRRYVGMAGSDEDIAAQAAIKRRNQLRQLRLQIQQLEKETSIDG